MSGPKRVLVLGGSWPSGSKPSEAADYVAHEFLRVLADSDDFEVAFLLVAHKLANVPDRVPADIEALKDKGVRFLTPVEISPALPGGRLPRLLRGVILADPAFIVPGAGGHDTLGAAIGEPRPSVVLTIWSEFATAVASGLPVPCVAYYGDPDPEIARANLLLRRALGRAHGMADRRHRLKELLAYSGFRRAHYKVMRRLYAVGDVSFNVVEHYRRHGVIRAFYAPCLRDGPVDEAWEAARDAAERAAPLKIAGSVGKVRGTGNTFAFQTLGREVLPALKRVLGEGTFEIHLYGSGQPYPVIAALLSDSHIKWRGFVADLDAELLSAPIFLHAHNYGPFKVAYSRILHAWSVGACVIAFRDSALAMPELKDGHNALLARTPAEMADLVAEAAKDRDLRRRLGRHGLATLRSQFNPEVVVAKVVEHLRRAALH